MTIKPKKWTEVYPYGTKIGDEESKVFIALARNKQDHKSIAGIVKTTGLSLARVEEIIDKYVNKISPPLIYQHPTNEDHWAYWERVPHVLEKDTRSLSQKDKDLRVETHLNK